MGRLEQIVSEMDARRRPWAANTPARWRSMSPAGYGTHVQAQRGADTAHSSFVESSAAESTQAPPSYHEHDEGRASPGRSSTVRFEDSVRVIGYEQVSNGGPARPRILSTSK